MLIAGEDVQRYHHGAGRQRFVRVCFSSIALSLARAPSRQNEERSGARARRNERRNAPRSGALGGSWTLGFELAAGVGAGVVATYNSYVAGSVFASSHGHVPCVSLHACLLVVVWCVCVLTSLNALSTHRQCVRLCA
jgi:hypothetical protein